MSSNKSAKMNIPKRDNKNRLHFYKDRVGEKIGKLVVEKYLFTNKRRKAVWLCKCECGNYIEVSSERLVTGNTRSCRLFI